MTWDIKDHQPVVGPCPNFTTDPKLYFTTEGFEIPMDTKQRKLNHVTFVLLNRQGEYCLSGHGPATFSDSAACAGCSKYKSAWFTYFLFKKFYYSQFLPYYSQAEYLA